MTSEREKQDFLIPGYNEGNFREKIHNLLWRIMRPLPDETYIRLKYRILLGRWPNLVTPRRYTEKILYRILHDRDPAYAPLIDKASAKEIVAEMIGREFIIPTFWVGTDLSAVDWVTIPKPFIVKPTHTSGQGATIYDQDDLERFLASGAHKNWSRIRHEKFNREWAYSLIEPRILIEEMVQTSKGIPWDYRFYVFDGIVRLIEINIRENGKGYSSLLSPDWDILDIRDPLFLPPYPQAIPKPKRLGDMLALASDLGRQHDFVRVDLYADEDWIKFGELTFYPAGGYEGFDPDETDLWLGDFWHQRCGPYRS